MDDIERLREALKRARYFLGVKPYELYEVEKADVIEQIDAALNPPHHEVNGNG